MSARGRKATVKKLATLLIALFVGLAHAGGQSWKVTILSVASRADESVVIKLHPEEPNGPWGACDTATIVAAYQKEPFGRRTWSEQVVTTQTHQEAIARLKEAASKGASIRIGEMGAGFKYPLAQPCLLESHGLALVEEFDHQKQVYSFYGAI